MTWAQMEFDHNPHPSTGIKLIGASEELIETLEDNQVKNCYSRVHVVLQGGYGGYLLAV